LGGDIALSLGQSPSLGNNDITEPDKFSEMLTGTYSGTAGDVLQIPDFYHVYGEEHNHPVAIVESAAIFTPSRHGESELAVKQAWWKQVFSDETHRRFPKLRMIIGSNAVSSKSKSMTTSTGVQRAPRRSKTPSLPTSPTDRTTPSRSTRAPDMAASRSR
jgi:hypothetical protein